MLRQLGWLAGLLPLVGLACTAEQAGDEAASDAFDLALTPAETDAVLDLVNEASLELLDDDVGLDKRAAENIVAHRQGADLVDDTADDNLFDSLAELDGVSYVGQSALQKLKEYVYAQGLVETGPTDDEALILGVVNTASFEVLDEDVGLDKRAAENIVAHRLGPDGVTGTADDDLFDDLEELDEIPYVGPAALDALLAYAKAQLPTTGACLIISEYIEGQGQYNKAIELYNCGDQDIDLGSYAICLVRNDYTTCTTTAALPASTLAPGAVRTVCRTKGGTFNDPMQFIKDRCEVELSSVMNFNGDDRIAIFRDTNADGAYGPEDELADMFGRFGYQPPVTTWQDVTLRRCNLTPTDGVSYFDHEDYFFAQSWGNQGDYGVPPTETCGSDTTALTADVFAEDMKIALVDHYATFGQDIAMMGGNTLNAAQDAVSAANIDEVTDPEDNPLGYDLATHTVFMHPDVVFPGSDMVWYGVYDEAGTVVEIAPFN